MEGRSIKAPSTVPRRLINRVMHKSNLAEQKCTPVAKEGDNKKKEGGKSVQGLLQMISAVSRSAYLHSA